MSYPARAYNDMEVFWMFADTLGDRILAEAEKFLEKTHYDYKAAIARYMPTL